MKLIADSGSTKTDWCITHDNGDRVGRYVTQGINPFHMAEETIRDIITGELLLQRDAWDDIDEIEFYGAGCTVAKIPVVEAILRQVFPHAVTVTVGSDMLGAAKALCGNSEGVACILGTGANSCLYDGEKITANVSPMGYILGDEGSGAVLGRNFLGELYKGCHTDFIPVFEKETGLTLTEIIQRVYRESLPNRFLASLTVFIHEHIEEKWVERMVIDCFRLFFRRNVTHYNRPDLPVHFIGSIAYYFQRQLANAAAQEGFVLGNIMKAPLD